MAGYLEENSSETSARKQERQADLDNPAQSAPSPNAPTATDFDATATADGLRDEMTRAAARIEALDAAGVVTVEDMRIHICV